MAERTIVIWGAGRIGRGFVADLFAATGYRLVFVDADAALVAMLRERGRYTVVGVEGPGRRTDRVIGDYTALTTMAFGALEAVLADVDLVAVAVFPGDFDAVARQIGSSLDRRFAERPDAPLDILLCTNLAHAGPVFREALQGGAPAHLRKAIKERVGIVESLVIRMVTAPPGDDLVRDPLLVWTNGYPEFAVARQGFRGKIPDLPFLRLVDDMRAEEMRKLFTYNTYHAALAYLGALRGCEAIVACVDDPEVRGPAEGALRESQAALQAALGYDAAEMDRWIDGVIAQTANPALGDTVARYAHETRRKLRRDDRLIGPLLLARDQGIATPFLERAVAAALRYHDADDTDASYIQSRVAALGLPRAVRVLCSLSDPEQDVIDRIVTAYERLRHEAVWLDRARRASELGFELERTYRGCGQCTVAALFEVLEILDAAKADAVFEAATGLAGGLGLCGDGPCGALVGASLVFGTLYPRRRAHFDGDRENKYRTYAMVQRLRARYLEKYGGLTCHDVHKHLFGRAFDLQDAEDRLAFEAAGAHKDKCTGVVARTVRWAVEIIGQDELAEV